VYATFLQSKKISHTDLGTILKAAIAVPSGGNARPWVFVVVTERLVFLKEKLPYAKILGEDSVAIIVCGDMDKAMDGIVRPLWINDCSMAAQNILLATEALGLGATYTAVFPDSERSKFVNEAFIRVT
jgi:nitroreductase